MRRIRRVMVATLGAAVLAAACGGGESAAEPEVQSSTSTTTTPSTTAPSTTTPSTTTPSTTTTTTNSHVEAMEVFGTRLAALESSADVDGLTELIADIEQYWFGLAESPTPDEERTIRSALAEARDALTFAELESGVWGPELDTPPSDAELLVDVVYGVAALGSDGEPLGWARGVADEHPAYSVALVSDEPDPELSGQVGLDCRPSPADPTESVVICDDPDRPDDGRMAAVFERTDGGYALLAGPAWGPSEEAPEGLQIAGRWRDVAPGEAGWLLGQWSGECEVPSAHLIGPDGAVWAVTLVGSDVVLQPKDLVEAAMEGDDPDRDLVIPASFAVGWLPDGRAAVHISEGPCSPGDVNGVYAIDPASHDVELIVATTRWVVMAD